MAQPVLATSHSVPPVSIGMAMLVCPQLLNAPQVSTGMAAPVLATSLNVLQANIGTDQLVCALRVNIGTVPPVCPTFLSARQVRCGMELPVSLPVLEVNFGTVQHAYAQQASTGAELFA